jgi:hypothetical protein
LLARKRQIVPASQRKEILREKEERGREREFRVK